MKNWVYFDLETQKSAQEVGGWHNISQMKMALGVTYSTARGSYEIYTEREVDALIQELMRADCVVGFNVLRFDYTVLAPYSIFDLTQIPTVDLLVDIEAKLNRRLKLDMIAEASLGVGKTADGVEALKWWKEGRLREIAEYCCYDVKTTRLVHEFGAQHGKVYYVNSRTHLKEAIPIPWKL